MPDVGLRVCILGAGVVGVTTAMKLQAVFGNNIRCTIVAEKFSVETTSHGAAGIFRPSTNFIVSSGDLTKKCIDDSYQYYLDLLNNDCGISEVSGYIFSRIDSSVVRNHFLEKLVPQYRQVNEEELSICPGDWKFGSYFTTLLIECKYYLPWAMKRFEENGGTIIEGKLCILSDLVKFGKFDLLFNCTGLGSKKLFNDQQVVPIRGQIFKVHAPWLDKFYYGDYDTYVIPCSKGVVTLGGTRQYESWRTDVCKHDSASIWERCSDLVPRLIDNAKILDQWVGLRPHRNNGVRLEAQNMGTLKIIHNYGHGGYGVTTAPGTADQAVKLAVQLIKMNKSKL